jgi:hypothetical protein
MLGYRLELHRSRKNESVDPLATSVALLSVGIGLATFLAPRRVAEGLGMADQETLIRAYGVREFTTGLGLLAGHERSPWLTARVGGDMLDLAALAPAVRSANPKRANVLLAIAAVVAISLLDLTCARRLGTRPAIDRGDLQAKFRKLAHSLDRLRGLAAPGTLARLPGGLRRMIPR